MPSAPDEAFQDKARALRPIYFFVVAWGEQFTDCLLQFCIPSLLSPNNIPALLNSGNKFLIATTDEDWKRIESHPIVALLKQYAEAVFIKIPQRPEGVASHLHMGIGHKLATQLAFEHRVYAMQLTPDLIVSDGTVATIQKRAVEGFELVVMPALRFGEEPFFEHLAQLGVASLNSRLGDEGRALVATGRQLVSAGIRGFHSETLTYEWDAPYFSSFPAACWWRVPGEDGVIVHSLSWLPLLVDYAAVAQHDSSMMDHWTIDGDYIHRNFGLGEKLYVVQDSDEAMVVSWAPLADRAHSLAPNPQIKGRIVGEWLKGLRFYVALCHPTFDPFKRSLFVKPVYWHARDLDEQRWRAVEVRAAGVLHKYGRTVIGDAARAEGDIHLHRASPSMSLRVARLVRVLSMLLELCLYYWGHRRRVLGIAKQALRGDTIALDRVKRSLRYLTRVIKGG